MPAPDQNPAPKPSPEDKARIEALVAQCIEAMERGESDPATQLCTGRPDLLTRVQRRLAQLAARGLIPSGENGPPTTIGPYRIVRELGSGGMGSVYLANQTQPVQRPVALKVIKLGMDTREVVARFQAERQALALMSHPHIAQVFDAGITTEGRPYFVMEFVAGQPLTAFCDERLMVTEQRVRLLATVARAVQHAHERGFIHRDLKPSNVLVTAHEGELVPKIIDFGIAKATAPLPADAEGAATAIEGLRTRADQVLGTPEYMSPEQARSGGLDVDTRTDVYSLGVVLYELLCGELPFDSRRLRRASRHEMEQILLDELPTQPSKRLSVVAHQVLAARGGERVSLQRRVAGELDWITLKALAKRRDQRYSSALALAEDLERWLRHEPVLAAPPGRTYRLRKFVRRHRVAVGAAVIVLIALVAGLAVSLRATWLATQAQQRESAALGDMRAFYGLARDAIGNLVDVADERLAEVPQADAIRQRLLADAIAFYEALRARQPRELELRIDLAAANVRIGVLQRRLGRTDDAVATLRQCVAASTALQMEAPTNPRVLELSVTAPSSLAHALTTTGHSGESKTALREALDALRRARANPAHRLVRPDVVEANLLSNLALESDDDLPACLELFEQALAAHARAASQEPADLCAYARCAGAYAEALTRQNRLDDAAKALGSAVARLSGQGAPDSAALRETEAATHEKFAIVLRRLARGSEARAAQQHAIDLYVQLAKEHPDVPAYADDEAAGLHFLAQLAEDEADLAKAIELMTRAVEIRDRLALGQPQNHRLRMRAVRSLMVKGGMQVDAWQQQGAKKDVAEATLASAVQRIDELSRDHGDDLEIAITFAAVHESVAAMLTTEQRFADAVREHLVVRDTLTARLTDNETNPELHYQLAVVGSNLVQSYFLARQPAAAVDAGEAGLRHLMRGLELDARHRGLLDLAPGLAARTSAAYFATDDDKAGIALLLRMCESPGWGPNAQETGALLLCEQLDGSDGNEDQKLLSRTRQELQAALTARGTLQEALARPPQSGGVSHTRSRLRDLDLRQGLATILGKLGDSEQRRKVLDEGVRLAESIPKLQAGHWRNLYAQRAEQALADDQPEVAATEVETLLARIGPDGRGNYMAAVLFVQCMNDSKAEPRRTQLGDRAVQCLQLALDKGEVKRSAASHPNFESLRDRPDYLELLEK